MKPLKPYDAGVLAFALSLCLTVSCGTDVSIDEVNPTGEKIEIGPAESYKDGCWWFKMNLNPEFFSPAYHYIGKYTTQVRDDQIFITARIFRSALFNGTDPQLGPTICGLEDGQYTVFYRDPDATTHLLGEVEINFESKTSALIKERSNKPISPTGRPVTVLAVVTRATVAQGLRSQARARSPRGLSAAR